MRKIDAIKEACAIKGGTLVYNMKREQALFIDNDHISNAFSKDEYLYLLEYGSHDLEFILRDDMMSWGWKVSPNPITFEEFTKVKNMPWGEKYKKD